MKHGTLMALGVWAFAAAFAAQGADVISIWGGARETIVLKSDGTVWTWGFNQDGKLGDGTVSTWIPADFSNDRFTPLKVHGPGNTGYLTSVTAVMGCEAHNVALKSDGTVWAWGNNSIANELGDGTTNNAVTPIQVSNLTSVIALGGRTYHTLAITSNGNVWAWGFNSGGQLGNGSTSPTTFPVQVVGLPAGNRPVAVSAGYMYSVALMSNSTVWTWGKGANGDLGNGQASGTMFPPGQVTGLTNVIAISTGWKHTLALRSDGTVWSWGKNFDGELGDGTTQDRSVPAQVVNLSNVVAVSGGDYNSAALTSDGTVWKWGRNDVGELGNGTADTNAHPNATQVTLDCFGNGFSNVIRVAARDYHNIAVKADGSVWMWGANDHGQCGDGTTVDRWRPVPVYGLGPTVLRVDARASGQPGQTDLQWNSGTGQLFSIYYRTNLASGTTMILQSNVAANGQASALTVPMTNEQGFYWLQLQ